MPEERLLEERLLKTVGDLYEAALAPGQWGAALAGVTELLGGCAYAHFLWDKRDMSVPRIFTYGFSDQVIADYQDHYAALEPGAAFVRANPQLETYWDFDWIDEPGMERHAFHAWLERESGVRYRFAGLTANSDRHFGVTALQRSRRQGPLDEAGQSLFRTILPHIRRATRIGHEFSWQEARRESWEDVLDGCGNAVLLLDRRGRVIFANHQAQAILAAQDGLGLDREGHCLLALPGERSRLCRMIALVASGSSKALDKGGALSVSRPSGRSPYGLLLTPLRSPALAAFLEVTPAAALFVTDPESGALPPDASLRACFGLTAGEARLALALLRRESLKAAAEVCGITHGTARQVLKGIFLKTGCHSQVGLVRRLLSLPAVERRKAPRIEVAAQ